VVEVKSKLRARIVISSSHEGEVTTVSQEDLSKAVKTAVNNMFAEEDDTIDVKVSVYVQEFTYKDNVDAMRERIFSMLANAGIEELEAIEETLSEETLSKE